MRRLLIATALLATTAAVAHAQSAPSTANTPRRGTGGPDPYGASDSMWSPQAYGLATAATPTGVTATGVASGGGSTTTVVVAPPPPPPEPEPELGKWNASVACDGTIQVCGEASRGRGWGFAVYNQHWECTTARCNPRPTTVALEGAACQTSTGALGYIFGPQCYQGLWSW